MIDAEWAGLMLRETGVLVTWRIGGELVASGRSMGARYEELGDRVCDAFGSERVWRQTITAREFDMDSATIVGYSYQADMWCDDCMREVGKAGALAAGSATSWGDCGSAEEILGEWALAIGLDREDETSFDDTEFPKLVRERDAHQHCDAANGYASGQCGDRCGQCHNPLGYECPNIPQ